MAETMETIEFPLEAVSYEEAIELTEKWLMENVLTEKQREIGIECKIYDYHDGDHRKLKQRPWTGVRVSEVSFHTSSGGGSYMQVDVPWGIAVCGQVERCILALVEGWNKTAVKSGDPGYAETDDEFWRLGHLFEEMNKDA